jgi:hypothetical protein
VLLACRPEHFPVATARQALYCTRRRAKFSGQITADTLVKICVICGWAARRAAAATVELLLTIRLWGAEGCLFRTSLITRRFASVFRRLRLAVRWTIPITARFIHPIGADHLFVLWCGGEWMTERWRMQG